MEAALMRLEYSDHEITRKILETTYRGRFGDV